MSHMLRFPLAVVAGFIVGLLVDLALAPLEFAMVGYLVSIVLAGACAALAVTLRAHLGRGHRVAVLAVTVVLTLAVAAPRPGAGGPDRVVGPSLQIVAGGHVLAYQRFDHEVASEAVPLVFLHGGPGVSTRAQDVPWLAGLSRSRTVFVYDQLGAGGSARLEDPTGYDLQRAREDLEQLRRNHGFERMILVGHSWGAVLAANYAVHHRDHVEALIALAPGALTAVPDVAGDPSVRLRGGDRVRLLTRLLRPREIYTYTLSRLDVHMAHRVAGDEEMDRRYDAILRTVWPAMFCDASLALGLPPPSGGFYANHVMQHTAVDAVDVPPDDPPPTLVVKPQCDYLPWSVVDGFVDLLDAHVVYVPGAGHAVHLERRESVAAVVEDFVAGRTPGGLLSTPKAVPATYEGPP
jgi:proline iminopeptidase